MEQAYVTIDCAAVLGGHAVTTLPHLRSGVSFFPSTTPTPIPHPQQWLIIHTPPIRAGPQDIV